SFRCIPPSPISTLFPYTTLFRSRKEGAASGLLADDIRIYECVEKITCVWCLNGRYWTPPITVAFRGARQRWLWTTHSVPALQPGELHAHPYTPWPAPAVPGVGKVNVSHTGNKRQ